MNTNTATHNASIDDVLKNLGIADSYREQYLKEGLSSEEAKARLAKYGPNAFNKTEHFYYLKLLWRQVKSPLVFILFIAGAIALVLGATTDAIVIFLAVVGSIYAGWATATEAAALGVIAALAIAIVRRQLTLRVLIATFEGTIRTTAMIMAIVLAAYFLNFVMSAIGLTGRVRPVRD